MKEVDCLVHTSADDLRTQTKYFRMTGVYPEIAVLREAHETCLRLGYKTKAKILRRVIANAKRHIPQTANHEDS